MAGPESHYPALAYMIDRARRRVPYFAWEYLASGTGAERLLGDNRAALDRVSLAPKVAQGRFQPDTSTRLLGQRFSVPFGAGPVGMSGLIWPGAELILAKAARENGFPYTLSMVANETPEAVAEAGGKNAWFQLYPLKEREIEDDLLGRAEAAGIRTLVVTLDVPVGSRRERQLAAGLTVPPKITPLTLWRVAQRPHWALATLRHGQPRFRTLETYFPSSAMADSAKMVGTIVDGRPDWATVTRLRQQWQGNLVIKGILSADEADQAIDCGADAVVVSNHGGRQFDAAPASIDALPAVAEKVAGRVPVVFDSGVLWGLDILRALSRGADFCLLGRGFLYAVAALGAEGGNHAYSVLKQDLETNMIQMGARTLGDVTGQR
ncbi:alpha-hydroxy acid oxidase [Pararhodobacter oceanensis]|uniref:alpha-hydroxy acid oxidase n=1 Tax=Pararhodobacter oceanensis TaxID=2172121 RepID=UPI003A916B86